MITEADLQAIVDGKRDVLLADAVVLWNEPAAASCGPVGALVVPYSEPMDCDRTRSLYGQVMDRYVNSNGACCGPWDKQTPEWRLTRLREIASNMVEDGLAPDVVHKALAVIPGWRRAH